MPTNTLAETPRPSAPPQAHGFLQAPGKALDDQRKDAPVEQQGRQGADHQYQWQGAKGQDEGGTGIGLGKRQLGTAKVTEDKGGPGRGGGL